MHLCTALCTVCIVTFCAWCFGTLHYEAAWEMFLMCISVSLVIEVIVMRKPWTTAMTNRNILATHSHWMLLKKSPLSKEQRRTLCFLLRTQGGAQMPLDLKVSWFDLSYASVGKSTPKSGLHSSLLSRVCFLLVTLIESGEWLQMMGKRSSHAFFLFCPSFARTDLIHACASFFSMLSVCAVSHCWEGHLWLLASFLLTLASPQMLSHSPHLPCPVSAAYLCPGLALFPAHTCLALGGTDSYEYISDSQAVLDLRLLHSSGWCL